MKNFFYLMGIAVAAVTSCAKDTLTENKPSRAIDFRVAAETRATETTTANLESFYVTAIDKTSSCYFKDVAYIRSGSYFLSSPSYFWPGDGSELKFAAYAPSATELGVTPDLTEGKQKLTGFSPASDISDQKDFVACIATGSETDAGNGVALTFEHHLSQIEVKAKNANPGYVYTIAGVKIANVISEGDFDFAALEQTGANPWALNESSKSTYSVVYNDVRVLDNYGKCLMKTEGDNAMLLPQQLVAWNPSNSNSTGAYISVYANICTAAGSKVFPTTSEEYGWLAIPVNTKWEAGNRYVYTLDFTNGAGYPENGGSSILGDPIKFTVNITPWNETELKEEGSEYIGKWKINHWKSTITYKDNNEIEIHEKSYEQIVEEGEIDEVVYEITFTDGNTYYLKDSDVAFHTMKDGDQTILFEDYGDKVYIHEVTPTTLTLRINYLDGSFNNRECDEEILISYIKVE
jgi:hypothetical protein